MDTQDILIQKNLGTWTPDRRLSNLAIMYYEDPTYAYKRVFPVCPVALPSGKYFEFNKADLARDNVHQKPPYGTVAPAVFGVSDQSYSCKVYQVLIGLDKIMTLPYQRANETFDPMKERVKTIAEQIALHQELDFAKNFFQASAWQNVWTGAAATNVNNKQFKKFDNSDVDPVAFFDDRAVEIRRNGRRRPNKLALGIETYTALKNNAFIKERIKYSGTTQNPAIVNEQVLAQVFGVDSVVVLDATYNDAGFGATESMKYVCDSKGALLLYAPETPQIDSPSAGYSFTWNINGNDYIAVDTHEGAPATHTELLEGILAYDMKITGQDLAIYFDGCVG